MPVDVEWTRGLTPALPYPTRTALVRARAERLLPWLRGAFLLAVVAGAWLGLRGRTDEVGSALGEVEVVGVLGALVLVLLGLSATGLLWLRLMAAPRRTAAAARGVGDVLRRPARQVRARLRLVARCPGHARAPPVRAGPGHGAAGLSSWATTSPPASPWAGAVLLGVLDPGWPTWVSGLLVWAPWSGLAPPLVRALSRRLAGQPPAPLLDTGGHLALMALAWAAYAAALVLLVPARPWSDAAALGGAFALSYALGVVVVLAPAGVGAREGLFVVLLTPLLGLPGATALAILGRASSTRRPTGAGGRRVVGGVQSEPRVARCCSRAPVGGGA